MVLIEMRESVMNDMIDEIAEAKKNLHMTKSSLCAIEDLVEELYHEDPSYESEEEYEPEEDGKYTGEIEVSYRNRRNMRNMHEDGESMMRRSRRMMRRNRRGYGRYSY